MKILITAGGTKEYIDGVRYIGNSSSGKTGAQLADYLYAQGHEVTCLIAKTAIQAQQINNNIKYETFDQLAEQLEAVLTSQHFDMVFHAAAVSDFKVKSVVLDGQPFDAGRDVKLPSAGEVKLHLSKQPKLVTALKRWSKNPKLSVVAFKLTNSTDLNVQQAAIDKLLHQNEVDWVAHNDMHDISDTQHGFKLYSKTELTTACKDIQTLSDKVVSTIQLIEERTS